MTARLIITAVLALLVGADAAPAADRGMFSITPARRDVAARPPVDLVPTVVGNSTRQTYRVRVFPVVLHQTLAGPFDFTETPGALREAANVIRVEPSAFTLGPRTRRVVRLRWTFLPEGRDAIAMGVVFQGTPGGQAGATLKTVSRLLSLNFLRRPGAPPARARIVGMRAAPDPVRRRRVLLVARVRNAGGSVGAPGCRASARVRDARGKVVRRVRWRGDVVAPGARREFAIPLPGVLPAGRYSAAVRFCFGASRRVRGVTRFELVGPGLLPAPGLTLRSFNAAGPPGGEARARGTFVSTGTAPAGSLVVVRLLRRSGATPGRLLRTVRVRVGPLDPGERKGLDIGLGTVRPGAYRATATYVAAPGTRATQTSDFAPLRQRSWTSRAWDWVTDHAGWLVAALLALLLLATRRRRRDEDEPDRDA